jgi:hypothetical protein
MSQTEGQNQTEVTTDQRAVGFPDYVCAQVADARESITRPYHRTLDVDRAMVWLADTCVSFGVEIARLRDLLASGDNIDAARNVGYLAGYRDGSETDAVRVLHSVLRDAGEHFSAAGFPGGYGEDAFTAWVADAIRSRSSLPVEGVSDGE